MPLANTPCRSSVFQVLRHACGPSAESAKGLRLLTKQLALFRYKVSEAGQLHICRPTIKFHGAKSPCITSLTEVDVS
jgi:hypothetical protein